MKPCFNSLSSRFKLLVWLLNCCVVIELTKRKNLVGKKVVMAGPMMMMPLNSVRRRNQEVPLIFTRALQWNDSSSSDDSGPYWNTFKSAPYYQPID